MSADVSSMLTKDEAVEEEKTTWRGLFTFNNFMIVVAAIALASLAGAFYYSISPDTRLKNEMASVASAIRASQDGSTVSLADAEEKDMTISLASYTSPSDFCLIGAFGDNVISYEVDHVVEACS